MEQTARPLWRKIIDFPLVAMIIAIALVMASVSAAAALRPYIPLTPKTPLSDFVRPLITILITLAVYKLIVVRLGRAPRDDLPFNASGARQFGAGLGLGFVLFSLVVGVAFALGVYHIDRTADARDLLWMAMGVGLVPGVTEEILFRGVLFRWLEELAGSWWALAVSSALFGLGHFFNPGATVTSTVAIALEAGILFGGLYMLTRNLWLCVGTHAAWNFTQGEIFDVPVSGFDSHGLVEARLTGDPLLSGGPFGLEASVIAMVLVTIVGVFFVMRAIRAGQLVAPMWVRRRLAREQLSVPATAGA